MLWEHERLHPQRAEISTTRADPGSFSAEDGQLGLWCVGRVLEKGTLLGLEEPDEINRKEKAEVCILVCFKFHFAPYS